MALDQIPQLMHELKSNGRDSGFLRSGHHDQFIAQKERHKRKKSSGSVSKPAGSPTRYDSPYNTHGASPPSPPPRALELVKEEVHRALQAFSTRPLKGETHPPLPRDLLRPYDTTRDGRITYPEFEAGLRGLGIGLIGGEAEALARDVDGGDTGLVDRERFETAAVGGWGREAAVAAAAATESFSATGHRNRNETILYDRGAPQGGAPPRDGKRVSWSGEGEQVEPRRCTDEFYAVEPGESRADGRRGRSRKVGDGGGGKAQRVSDWRGASGKSRSSAVSFEQWHRRMTAGGGDDGHAAKAPPDSVSISVSVGGRGKAKKGRARSSCGRADSLDTLRSLLREEGADGESAAVEDGGGGVSAGNHCRWFESRDHRGNMNGPQNRTQQHQRSSRREGCALPGAGGNDIDHCGGASGGGGGGRRGGAGARKSLAPSRRRAVDPDLYSAATQNFSQGGERRTAGTAAHDADGDTSASLQEAERAQHKNAGRAESILRVRSRGDLVGLRRALSRADPSGSGVISQREMERVVLRRFGSGFSDDEARGLALRYGKEISGREMVDYGRLFDSLEAKEAGLCGGEATPGLREQQPSVKEKDQKHAGSTAPRSLVPAAAGARTSNRRAGGARIAHEGDGDGDAFVREVPPEESQLARRARAKTLALLDLHGTRSVDQVFGLIDPGRAQSLTAEQLREGLRVLSGSDPLSDIEYKALFRDVGGKQERVKHRELLDTLRNAEGVESRERTQRKLAHQARLPVSGRGSAVHWRHSDILDWYPPASDKHSLSRTPGGKQHKETRRRALVFEKIRERVRRVQDDRNSAGPVLDMFHRRGGGGEGGNGPAAITARDDADGNYNPPPLSPSALRAGLRSLGVPLGDEDFDAVLANTDPSRHGEVSYPDFCEVLRLHRLRDNPDRRPGAATAAAAAAASGLKRPSSAPPQLSSQAIGQGIAAASGAVIARGERGGGGGGGGSARRRAMELAPAGDFDLDGGVFHRNPATDGCANPNFTTTMVPAWDDDDVRNGRGGGTRGRGDGHRPGRRQSPAPAPLLLTASCTVVGRPRHRGQTVIGDNRFQPWNETGAGAERRFRQDLGAKARRHRSHLLSCHGDDLATCEGWDNMGTPSPRTAAEGIESWRNNAIATAAATNGGSSGGSISRRGRGLAPRDSDLGFGSARMRSASRHDDRCSVTSTGERRRRHRRRRDEIDEGAGLTRRRSMSLGVEDRYGEWARSSVGDLLRHDSWLGARCHTAD
ncbi:unnamed protein product, partial [Laminaria digitata]